MADKIYIAILMNIQFKKFAFLATALLVFISSDGNAQQVSTERQIIASMDDAALKWNKGDLEGYMALYDASATMMTASGRVGIDSIRRIYLKYYFQEGHPKQELSYDGYQLTMLGDNYALLTGRFVLKANEKLPRRTGIFSLTLVHRKDGWKILHDHSG